MQKTGLDDIQFDASSLYREDQYTDMKVGTIRVLTPVDAEGKTDPNRSAIYVGQTEIMSNMGMLPISGKIDAANLSEAIQKFPETIKKALEEMVERMQQMQREQASRIVTPDELGGGGKVIPGAFGGQPGGSGNLIL
ncbi:MAG: hypothetical protein H7A43_04830 [Verrucomicrobia bacterium]|nr:hypothetical protein [Kiritimatiellia bacterium]MCB1100828.1 hypothetical protein [Kiritimatiellia bacterium]MCP5487952.1 hypothetical protein [Verrucomicrobiota bacterium]